MPAGGSPADTENQPSALEGPIFTFNLLGWKLLYLCLYFHALGCGTNLFHDYCQPAAVR